MVVLPDWLALGLAIAAGLAVIFATVFFLGERFFPARTQPSGNRGEWKRRAEIRSYLDHIDERYTEDTEIHGHTVAFYLPNHDVAITFDGVTYFRLNRTPTYAILVEHEMPGAHLGTRLPFDTPGPTATPTASNSNEPSPFDILGVSQDASPEEITAAYRERVKEVHPDHGGNEEAFRRVREAYTAARDAAS